MSRSVSALLALKMEEEATSQVCGQTLEAGKGEETDPPQRLQKGMLPCPRLEFGPVKLVLDLMISRALRYFKLCCFKLLSLWSFVTAAIESQTCKACNTCLTHSVGTIV